MTSIPADKRTVKSSVDIVQVASRYTELKERFPGDYWGLSPFSDESTASFHVVSDGTKSFFYCFSTGKGGDVFDLIKEVENVSFPEAVERAAEFCGGGVALQPLRPSQRIKMPKKQSAPPNPPDTRTLQERGHDMDFLKKSFGVIQLSSPKFGEYWAYSARDFDGSHGRTRMKFRDKSIAGGKYRYHKERKGMEPCGYPLDKIHIPGNTIWIVNGEPSVWLCWQYGIQAFCSLSETSYKRLPELMALLNSNGKDVIHILLDNDEAGLMGTIKAAHAARDAGFEPNKIFPHVWDSSKGYKRGYDVADLLLDTNGKGLVETLPTATMKQIREKLSCLNS